MRAPRAVALALVLAASPALAQEETRVDWPAFLADQDLTWEALPDDWWSGAFTGNGGLGAMIWYDHGALRFDLGHTEFWDHQADGGIGEGRAGRTRLNPGSLALHLVGAPVHSSLRLDLWNAEVRGEVTTTAGTVRVRTFTHASRDVMVVELTTTGGEGGATWSFTPAPARAYWGSAPRDNPPPMRSRRGTGHAVDQALTAGGGCTTLWREATLADGRRVLVAAVAVDLADGPRTRAGALVDAAHADGVGALAEGHRAWWHAYWPRSWLTVPDAALRRFYWVQMYKLASATRADRPVYDLLGPWGRDTRWAGLWWNLNVQMAYWPVYASGRLELGLSLVRALDRARRAGVLAANEPVAAWRDRSAALATTSDHELRSAITLHEHCDLLWAVHNVWLQYRYSMDDALLRDVLVPLLRPATGYYLLRLTRAPVADRWNIPAFRSPEYDVEGPNPAVDVALLRWALGALIDADERLGLHDPQRTRWESVRRELVDLPADATGITVATGVPLDHPHREPAHLMAVYPLHQLRWDTPGDRTLMARSVDRWIRDPRVGLAAARDDRSGYSYTWASQLAATMGRGDEAMGLLRGAFDFVDPTAGTGITPNTFYRDGSWPTSETPMGVAAALHDLLLQSHGGVVAVFPATPAAWREAEFQGLRAEGAFAVGAVRAGGVTRSVVIESLAGEPCRVRSDLPRPWRLDGARPFTAVTNADGTVSLDLRRGERVRITTEVTPPDAGAVAVDAGTVDAEAVEEGPAVATAGGGCAAAPRAAGGGWLLALGLLLGRRRRR